MAAIVKVLVADAHPLILMAVAGVLGAEEGIEVVASTSDGRAILRLVERERPTVVLLDTAMPYVPGMVALKRIRERCPEVRVVVFGDGSDVEVEAVLRLGAAAYVVRSVEPIDLPSVIRLVAAGSLFTSSGDVSSREGVGQTLGLSARELDIFSLLAGGASNKAIAAALWVTEQTVKFHLTNIYRKLGVKNRTDAARLAFVHGLDGTATPHASPDAAGATLSQRAALA